MDNREDYDYGWNEKGQRFHALKSGDFPVTVQQVTINCPLLKSAF
jgi:hypothetical protein